MKKIIVILSWMLLINLVSAVDFDYSGELRTRGAATYDDVTEEYQHNIQNRFRLNLEGTIDEKLALYTAFEVGDFAWGTYGGEDFQVETNEVYLRYLMPCMDASLQVGKMYWADHRSLIMDDYFTGALFTANDLAGMKAELGLMKYPVSLIDTIDAPSTWFMASVHNETYLPMGLTIMAAYQDTKSLQSVSIMPYLTLNYKYGSLDLTPFVDNQLEREETGYGIAMKADIKNGPVELGADVLFAAKNGLTALSSWYQNGLYLYGIGPQHDGLNLYWSNPYALNENSFTSLVGKANFIISDKAKLFTTVGTLTDLGSEMNMGLEFSFVPDTLTMAIYGAMGKQDGTDRMDEAIGSTLMLNF